MDQTTELLSAWIDTARDYAIILLDPDGRVSSWNVGAERILGYPESEAIGLPLEIFFTPEDRQKKVPEREVAEALATGRASDDRWHMRKDTSRFWCSGVLMRVRDEDGTNRGFVKVMRDLTERKLMEERLRSRTEELMLSDRRRNEFLAMLSHELRNPLAPILTGVYLLREVMPEDNQVASEARDMIERQAMHLKRMVDDLLDVSRMALNRIELRRTTVDLAEVARRAVESVRPILVERRHELTVSADPEPIAMSADPIRLEQAIAALLSNAAKFTDPGGRIAMTIGRVGDQAVVRVRDSGIGLSPEMLVRAFEMFAQGDQGLARTPGGLGIGLTLARNLVRLHGGTVEAASEGPGHGSEFIVRLPIIPTPSDATPTASAPTAFSPRNGTLASTQNGTHPEPAPPVAPARPVAVLRVLLVDDNRDAARSTELLLRRAGHEVLVAHDGPAALDLAFKEHPDLVILDVGLPYIDGYGVAREIRRQSSIPLVALTGYAPEESTSLLFDAYLVKPVNPAELVQLMGDFTRSKPRP
jgi:PAS domain S-box-containing protein